MAVLSVLLMFVNFNLYRIQECLLTFTARD